MRPRYKPKYDFALHSYSKKQVITAHKNFTEWWSTVRKKKSSVDFSKFISFMAKASSKTLYARTTLRKNHRGTNKQETQIMGSWARFQSQSPLWTITLSNASTKAHYLWTPLAALKSIQLTNPSNAVFLPPEDETLPSFLFRERGNGINQTD